MNEEFQFFDSYEDYIMNYLTQIESESDDVLDMLDMLPYKNTKFLFYQFNQYLAQIGKPLKLIRHTVIADDSYVLTIIQEKKWQYFMERLLERSLQTTDDEQTFFADGIPQENFIGNDPIKNIAKIKIKIKILAKIYITK